ncbi:MAG: glycosyltransferase family 4 protein [Pseudarthrobacter sp.]|nr:glycosyltransferase family 4 protein [Pseudarthrobacter sp.]
MPPIRLLVPGNIHHSSGGNIYNARLVAGLKALGEDVEVVPVEGHWPTPGARDRRRFGTLLGAWEPSLGPEKAVAVVDGLVAVGAPDELESAAGAGRETWILEHMPLPETSDPASLAGEARALRAAAGVVCTSTWAATRLRERGIAVSGVALPGVEPAAEAPGSVPPHFAIVAALLPNKDQLLAVEALALLQDLEWTAALVGSDQADPGYAGQVRATIAEKGLQERVRLVGEVTGQALEDQWARTNLSLLVSRNEAFGMAVTESLARSIPVLVREGTGAVEALSLAGLETADGGPRLPGAAVALPEGGQDSPRLLAGVLRRWLEDPECGAAWRAAARDARPRLPDWNRTARTVLEVLAGPGGNG